MKKSRIKVEYMQTKCIFNGKGGEPGRNRTGMKQQIALQWEKVCYNG